MKYLKKFERIQFSEIEYMIEKIKTILENIDPDYEDKINNIKNYLFNETYYDGYNGGWIKTPIETTIEGGTKAYLYHVKLYNDVYYVNLGYYNIEQPRGNEKLVNCFPEVIKTIYDFYKEKYEHLYNADDMGLL